MTETKRMVGSDRYDPRPGTINPPGNDPLPPMQEHPLAQLQARAGEYANTAAEVRKKSQRVPLKLVCPAGVAHEAQAMREGLLKYGYASFLNEDVKMTMLDCIGAAERHLEKLKAGIDYDPSGAHHAGHARAMLGILLECMEQGKLVDDRHPAHTKDRYIERMYDRMEKDNAELDARARKA